MVEIHGQTMRFSSIPRISLGVVRIIVITTVSASLINGALASNRVATSGASCNLWTATYAMQPLPEGTFSIPAPYGPSNDGNLITPCRVNIPSQYPQCKGDVLLGNLDKNSSECTFEWQGKSYAAIAFEVMTPSTSSCLFEWTLTNVFEGFPANATTFGTESLLDCVTSTQTICLGTESSCSSYKSGRGYTNRASQFYNMCNLNCPGQPGGFAKEYYYLNLWSP